MWLFMAHYIKKFGVNNSIGKSYANFLTLTVKDSHRVYPERNRVSDLAKQVNLLIVLRQLNN